MWSPSTIGDIDRVEAVQRRFTKKIKGLKYLAYPQRLEHCNLECLELRRIKRDLVLVYRIIRGKIGLCFDRFFMLSHSTITRGHSFKLYPKPTSTQLCLNSFAFRVVNVWNGLPSHVVEASSVNVFKKRLDACGQILKAHLRGRAIRDQ